MSDPNQLGRRSSLDVRLRAILDSRRDRGISGLKATMAYGAFVAVVVFTVVNLRAETPVTATPVGASPPPIVSTYRFVTLAGASAAASFANPYGLAVDHAGNVYTADCNDQTILKITPAGVVTIVAGVSRSSGELDGPTSAATVRGSVGEAMNIMSHVTSAVDTARFSDPFGVAVDAVGILYVADRWNHGIRKITIDGEVATLAGSRAHQGSADGPGSTAGFLAPMRVAVDWARNVYVADTGNSTIRKITPDGIVSTLAGMAQKTGAQDGRGAAARFAGPQGVAVDGDGNVYVADTNNQTIRKITRDGAVTTVAGSPGGEGSADGKGTAARFWQPQGVTVDHAGNLFVADTANHTIRKITPDGTVTTVAGLAGSTEGTVDGTGSVVRLLANGVAVDESGNLYIAGDYRIRKGTLVRSPVLPPAPSTIPAIATPSPAPFPHTNLDSVLSALQWADHNLRLPLGAGHEDHAEKGLAHFAPGLTATSAAIDFNRANPSHAAEIVRATPEFETALAGLNAALATSISDPRFSDALESLKNALEALRNAPGGDLGGARDKIIASIAQTADDVIAGAKF